MVNDWKAAEEWRWREESGGRGGGGGGGTELVDLVCVWLECIVLSVGWKRQAYRNGEISVNIVLNSNGIK